MRIAQISDTHISLGKPNRVADLERCVRQINALDPPPDVVIHSGDISHNGLNNEYVAARNLLNTLSVPWFVMAGNRDKRDALVEVFFDGHFPQASFPFVQYSIDTFPVKIVCADTVNIETNKGELCELRLSNLNEMLSADPSKPTVVFMHHPPFDVDVAPDPMQFVSRDNAQASLELVAQHPAVRGLFCGHVHRPDRKMIGKLPVAVMTAVAIDLRFGEKAPPSRDKPLYVLHDLNDVCIG